MEHCEDDPAAGRVYHDPQALAESPPFRCLQLPAQKAAVLIQFPFQAAEQTADQTVQPETRQNERKPPAK